MPSLVNEKSRTVEALVSIAKGSEGITQCGRNRVEKPQQGWEHPPPPSGETKQICAFLETFSRRNFYNFVKTSCDQRCLYSVTIETRTECFHTRRGLKRTIGDLGPNTFAEILKLFYSCSFKNKTLYARVCKDVYVCEYTETIKFIFFVRSVRRIQNKQHFEIATFIFNFSEQFKIQ